MTAEESFRLAGTMLKTGSNRRATVQKVAVVFLTTLANNWSVAFLNGLGSERTTTLALSSGAQGRGSTRTLSKYPR